MPLLLELLTGKVNQFSHDAKIKSKILIALQMKKERTHFANRSDSDDDLVKAEVVSDEVCTAASTGRLLEAKHCE